MSWFSFSINNMNSRRGLTFPATDFRPWSKSTGETLDSLTDSRVSTRDAVVNQLKRLALAITDSGDSERGEEYCLEKKIRPMIHSASSESD